MTAVDDLEFPLKRSVSMIKKDPEAAKAAFHAVAQSKPICPSCRKPVKHREGVEWCEDQRMSEDTLKSRVTGRAKRRGWDVKHIGKGLTGPDGVWISTAKGFPDLFMLHEGQRRVLAIELKRETGVFEPGQLEYLDLLNACGIPAVVIRPHQLRNGELDAILGSLT
jgi:hypothetical protein